MTATTDRRWINPEADAYRPEEVAQLFGVQPRTVTDWARAGRFPAGKMFRTPGGHRRYDGPYIRSLLAGDSR